MQTIVVLKLYYIDGFIQTETMMLCGLHVQFIHIVVFGYVFEMAKQLYIYIRTALKIRYFMNN